MRRNLLPESHGDCCSLVPHDDVEDEEEEEEPRVPEVKLLSMKKIILWFYILCTRQIIPNIELLAFVLFGLLVVPLQEVHFVQLNSGTFFFGIVHFMW